MNKNLFLFALAGLGLLPPLAHAEPEVVIDAAVEGGGKDITKAYFVAADYYVVYDWGQDRVSGGPRPLTTLPFTAPFASGIDAGLAGFGGVKDKGFILRGRRYLRFDAPTGAVERGFPIDIDEPLLTAGVDSAVNGLGPLARYSYFFKGDQYVKIDTVTNVAVGPKAITAGWYLPAGFASRIDAAVNGAGNFAGKGYFFHGDEYVRYNWVADRPETQPQKIAAKWPGLVELLLAARSVSWNKAALDKVLPILIAGTGGDLHDALRDQFRITSSEDRARHLPTIIRHLQNARAALKDPGSRIRFRTSAEANTDGAVSQSGMEPVYLRDSVISITHNFVRIGPRCRASRMLESVITQSGGPHVAPAAATTPDAAVADAAAYVFFVRQLTRDGVDKVCPDR